MDQNATLNGRIEQEFKGLDRGWVAAYLQGTTELFDRVWANGFIFTSPFGQLLTTAFGLNWSGKRL